MVKAKRLEIILSALFLLVVITFSLFGEKIYDMVNPHVTVARSAQRIIDGMECITIPKEAYFDGIVYITCTKEGFLMTHTCVSMEEVCVEEIPGYPDLWRVTSGLTAGVTVINACNKPLEDGIVVIVE